MPVTLVEHGGLVVAETPSGCGSDPAYSLVVRRPLGVATVHSGGLSTSSATHVRLHRHATPYSGDGHKLLEIGECSSRKPQEVRYARFDELSRKTDVRLDSNSKCITDNGVKNCNRLVRLNNENLEAVRVWNVGQELGFSCLGNEEEVLDSIKSLKERDNRNEGLSRDGLNDLDDENY